MDKKEMGFFLIMIIAYIALSILFNLSIFAHIIFIMAAILFFVATWVLKVQEKYDNEKISSISEKICILLVVVYILLQISAFAFKMAFFELNSPIIVLIFITLFVSWFFKNNKK